MVTGAAVAAGVLVAVALVLTRGGEQSVLLRTVTAEPAAAPIPRPAPAHHKRKRHHAAPAVPIAVAPAPPPALVGYSATYYTVDRPAGWTTEHDDQPQSGGWLRAQWRNPADSSASLLIDAQEEATSAQDKANEVRAATAQTPGYREISFSPTTMNGVAAIRWEFEVSGTRRVDYFVHDDSCGVGVAVLGTTSPGSWSAHQRTFSAVADSISIDCSNATAANPPASSDTSGCDPNYQGACLDPTSPDYDCVGGSGDGPDYTGEVTVVGNDHFGLDRDGDGTACEPY